MSHHHVHRPPRAGVDRIDDERDALALVSMAVSLPYRPETIAFLLDHERRGMSILVVDGTTQPDDLFTIIDMVTALATDVDEFGGLIVATVRPHAGADPRDATRWREASQRCEEAGVDLVEWFVVGSQLRCPRSDAGEPPRWGQ